MTGVKITALNTADGNLKSVTVEAQEGGNARQVACDGLFVAIGLIPENDAFASLADLNSWGYFDSDERCETKTAGLFVAGDCRSKSVRQLTTAAADGATAALAACRYIDASLWVMQSGSVSFPELSALLSWAGRRSGRHPHTWPSHPLP